MWQEVVWKDIVVLGGIRIRSLEPEEVKVMMATIRARDKPS